MCVCVCRFSRSPKHLWTVLHQTFKVHRLCISLLVKFLTPVYTQTKILQVPHPCLAQQSRWQMDMLKWSTPLSIWVAWTTPLVAAEVRSCVGLGIARSCMNLLEKKNLEVKHQAGYQDTPHPDLHSPCLVVWVRDIFTYIAWTGRLHLRVGAKS